MTDWRKLPGEFSHLYSPIGLRLVDELTGQLPVGDTTAELEVRDGVTWYPTEIPVVRTPRGVMTYPGLGRQSSRGGPPSRHYRVRVSAALYRPWYRAIQDGIEFDAPRYDDGNPPAPVTTAPQTVLLVPAPNYPFQPHVPVLRGVIRDQVTQRPVPDVRVELVNSERVLSDESGCFALPMRFTPPNTPVTIDALDQRTNRVGQLPNISLPAALGQSHTITIA
jgi:hypothetical protein